MLPNKEALALNLPALVMWRNVGAAPEGRTRRTGPLAHPRQITPFDTQVVVYHPLRDKNQKIV